MNISHLVIGIKSAVLLVLIGTASTAIAVPFAGGPQGALRLLKSAELNLTSEQRDAIRAEMKAQRDDFKAGIDALHTTRKALLEYLKNGGSDEKTLAALKSAVLTAMAGIQDFETGMFQSVYALLTSDQKATLAGLSLEEDINSPGRFEGRRFRNR